MSDQNEPSDRSAQPQSADDPSSVADESRLAQTASPVFSAEPPHPSPPPLPPVTAASAAETARSSADPTPPFGSPAFEPSSRALGVSPQTFGRAASAGVLAVGFALVAAVVVIALSALVALVAGAPSTSSAGGPPVSIGDVEVGGIPFLGPIVWIATLGLLGQLSGGLDVAILGSSSSIQLGVFLVPVLVLLASVGGAMWWSYRSELRERTASRGAVWMLAALSGLVAGTVAILLSLLGRTSVTTGGGLGGAVFEVSTFTVGTFFGPVVLITLASAAGRWLARGAAAPAAFGRALWDAPSRFTRGARDLYDCIAVAVAIFVPVSLIVSIAAGSGLVTAWPIGLGVLAVVSATLGHLGAYSVQLNVPGLAAGGARSSGGVVSLFGDNASGWAWLLLVPALIGVLLSGVLIARRRAAHPVPPSRAWLLPVLVVGASLVIGLVLGSGFVFGSVSVLGVGGGLSVILTPAIWTYLFFGIAAALVEVVARYVGPPLLSTMPALGRWRAAGDGVVVPEVSGTPRGAVIAQPLSARARRGLLVGSIVTGALVVVVAGIAIAVSLLQNSVYSPKAAAQAYLHNIETGNYRAAAKLSGESGEGLLASSHVVLEEPIDHVVLGEPTILDGSAAIPISFRVDGEKQNAVVRLHSTGREYVVFEKWKVDTGLMTTIEIYTPGVDTLTIGGVSTPIDEDGSTVAAYPGVYDVQGPKSKWVSVSLEPLTVAAGGGSIDAQAEPSQDLIAEVQRQVDAAVDACARSTDAAPAGCPFSLFAFSDVRNVKWKVGSYPKVELAGFTSFYGSDGDVTATYEEKEFFGYGWTSESDSEPLFVSGDIAIDGDAVTVSMSR